MSWIAVTVLFAVAHATPSTVTWKSDTASEAREPAPILISADAEVIPDAGAAPPATVHTSHNVSIDVRDADIRSVFRLLSHASGVDFVIGDEVQSTVDVQLLNVPWAAALSVILSLEGLHATEGPGGILVISVADKP